MRAMILAAGLGTRLRPLTEKIPKALIKIKGHTLLELQINKLKSAGFDKIIINIHHHAKMIKDFLNQNEDLGCDIEISDETENLLDTGGGLKKASWFFSDNKPFLVHNVDVLSDINLVDLFHQHFRTDSLATLAVMERKSSRFLVFDEENKLAGWKNEIKGESKVVRKPIGQIKLLAFSGIQIINPKIFNYFPQKDVFSLVDFYLSAATEDKIDCCNHSGGKFLDLGKKESLQEAEVLFDKIKSTYQA
ncbi:MAG: nucleotidyltransferase family protein [Ignavibacteria bacterium]|nr:nucleotidyltransferase family protein [Ignavibacteria bacterium]NNL22521.1 nucleotidyltransferase family protein [Ignavibacteriaceae bacterium]